MKIRILIFFSLLSLLVKAQTCYTSFPGNLTRMFVSPLYITMEKLKVVGPLNCNTDIETLRIFSGKEEKPLTVLDLEDAYFCSEEGLFSIDESIDEVGKINYIPDYLFASFKLRRIVIPSITTIINKYAFSDCIYLQNVVFPKNLQRIEEYAFWNCDLKQIELPENLKYIGRKAFSKCNLVSKIIIPASVEEVDYDAFEDVGAYFPADIWMYSNVPPSIPNLCSVYCSNNKITLHVPIGCTEAYAATAWGKAANIVEYDNISAATNIKSNNTSKIEAIYDMNGKRCEKIGKGTYIILYNNKTTKEFRR